MSRAKGGEWRSTSQVIVGAKDGLVRAVTLKESIYFSAPGLYLASCVSRGVSSRPE